MNSGYSQHFKKIRKNASRSQSTVKKNIKSKMPIKKARKPFPFLTLVLATFILGGSTWLYINIDVAEAWLSKVEIRLFGAAIAQQENASAKKNLPSPDTKAEKTAPGQSESSSTSDATVRNLTPEELALFNKLEERRIELDKREAELAKLEEELQQQKVMLEEKLKSLEEMRNSISMQLDDRVKADASRIEKLVAMYSNMKPQKAAAVLETVNEDLAVEVLRNMKRDKAADILNMLDAAKAQKLSEKFAGYRKD